MTGPEIIEEPSGNVLEVSHAASPGSLSPFGFGGPIICEVENNCELK